MARLYAAGAALVALPQPKRAAGTYVTLDKARLTTLLERMSAPVAILVYLEGKTNYEHDGATLGELIDALSRSPKTLQNVLSLLKREGEVYETGGRFYPGPPPEIIRDTPETFPENREDSRPLSRTLSRDASRTLSRKSGNRGMEKPVPDELNGALKEEKELEGRERSSERTPENPFEVVQKIVGTQNAAWLRDRRNFDFALSVATWGEKLPEIWQKALVDPPRKPRDKPIFRFQDACEGILDLPMQADGAGFSSFSGRGVKNSAKDLIAEKHRRDREEWAKLGVVYDA